MKQRRAVMGLALLVACGGSDSGGRAEVKATSEATSGSEEAPEAAVTAAIERQQLNAVLDAGLGQFLRGIETQPYFKDKQFVGFRILSIYPDDPNFSPAKPTVGDVVMRVNGQPIERPEQAMKVWEGLRVASELRIVYLRDGEPQEVRYEISE